MSARRNWLPLLVPESLDMTSYSGFVKVFGKDYLVRVWRAENLPRNWQLEVDPHLHNLLQGELAALQTRLQCSDLDTFLEEFHDILERASRTRILGDPPQAASMETIVSEIMAVGWDRVTDLNDSFQVLQLRIDDAARRPHVLEVQFPHTYPSESPRCRAALPKPFHLKWEQGYALKDVVSQFSAALEIHQDMWDVLDDLDRNTWVLEPERPTRDIVMRRIAIGNHCSMQLDFAPANPRGVPEVRFLGADSVIVPLRERLNEHLVSWSAKEWPRINLQYILQREFPARTGTTGETASVECAICYTYRLDGALPDIVCDNPKCLHAHFSFLSCNLFQLTHATGARPFHGSCLHEWLRSVPSTRQAFNTLFGSCTYCGHNISLPNVSSYN